MRLLVISDTHGNYQEVLDILERAGRFDTVIHLGDEVEDALLVEAISGCRVISIAGNCDRASSAPRELHKVLAGVSFFMTHGDAYLVKGGLSRLRDKAVKEETEVVLYGHTHAAAIEIIDGIRYVNPGALASKGSKRSYAVITVDSGNVSAGIVEVSPPPSDAFPNQHPHPQL